MKTLRRVLFCTCPAACCCFCPEERRWRRRHKRRRRKERGESVSSSDADEKPTVSRLVTQKLPPLKINGKHVVIPINRLPPTPTPPGLNSRTPTTMHLTVPTALSPTATLPNYISDGPQPGPSAPPRPNELVLNASMLV